MVYTQLALLYEVCLYVNFFFLYRVFLMFLFGIFYACQDNLEDKEPKTNIPPKLKITSHPDQHIFGDGYTIPFQADITDENHKNAEMLVAWFANDQMVCDWSSVEPNGKSSCVIKMSEEMAWISAQVVDPDDAIGQDSISVSVTPTFAPQATIYQPDMSSRYYKNIPILFQALIEDTEDTQEQLQIRWWSDVDGVLSLDNHFVEEGLLEDWGRLTEGQHQISVEVTDTTGKTTVDSVIIDVGGENTEPSCSILTPTEGFVGIWTEDILFSGMVSDEDINNARLNVTWLSDLDGVLSTNSPDSEGFLTFVRDQLTIGHHVITLVVQDDVGGLCSATVPISIGTLPNLEITNPSDGDVFSVGEAILFRGHADDQEDSFDDIQVTWTSDTWGLLHTSTPDSLGMVEFFVDILPAGFHNITVSATDSDGLTTIENKNIRVNTPPNQPLLSLYPLAPITNQNLVPHITSTDDDGDVVTFSYVWQKNGVATLFSGEEVSIIPALAEEETTVGDLWSLEVTPFDGFAFGSTIEVGVEIQNTPPIISALFIDTIIPYNDQNITCSATAIDLDEELELEFNWLIQEQLYFGATVDLSTKHVMPNDSVTCIVYVEDSYGVNDTISGTVIIGNRPPEQPIVEISPSEPRAGIDDIICEAHSNDLDGSIPSYSYEWFVNGQLTSYSTNTISGSVLTSGDVWRCQVTPFDEIDFGVSNSADVVVSSCYFGFCDLSLDLGNDIFMDFVRIEGIDLEGSSFTLQTPFYMMTTEVSQGMFQQLMNYDSRMGENTDFGDGIYVPAYYVSWHMAAHFASELSILQGEENCYSCTGIETDVYCEEIVPPEECTGYALPTEVQWELSAQSGTTTEFWTGEGSNLGGSYSENICHQSVYVDDGVYNTLLGDLGYFCGNSTNMTSEIAQKLSNGFGLYDMHGNISEWTADRWGCSFPAITGWCDIESFQRILRGGGWNSEPDKIRSTYRHVEDATFRSPDIGFRLQKGIAIVTSP